MGEKRQHSTLPALSLVLVLAVGAIVLGGCSDTPPAGREADSPSATPLATPTSTPTPPLLPEQRALAVTKGQAIATETFGLLSSNLMTAIQSGGVSNALPFCSLAASPLTAGIAARHGVTLRRVSLRPRNPAGRADSLEQAVIRSFEAALATSASTNPPAPWVTNVIEGTVTYLAPILLSRELCLKCHGEPGRDIAESDLAVIRRLYPADEATGFRLGQVRGAWRIDLPLARLASEP